jgi:hypothetical protein
VATASIYYHPASSEPSFVLIDGEQADVLATDYGPAGRDLVGARIGAIDHACRRLGWKVVDAAPIVRQADGRATIRIEPLPELLAAADKAVDASDERAAGQLAARIDIGRGGTVPVAVHVDGRTAPVHTLCGLTSSLPNNADRARQAVNVALATLGYHPTGAIEFVTDGTHMEATVLVASDEWRDVPTMVRIDDDTARALNDMSQRLGIPGDTLAVAWIRRAAADARSRVDWWTSEGYIEDPARITGWDANGTPHLKGD